MYVSVLQHSIYQIGELIIQLIKVLGDSTRKAQVAYPNPSSRNSERGRVASTNSIIMHYKSTKTMRTTRPLSLSGASEPGMVDAGKGLRAKHGGFGVLLAEKLESLSVSQ